MKTIKSIEEAKAYLDYLKQKNKDEFENEEYIPLEDFFFKKGEKEFVEYCENIFTYNDYLDDKITFEEMLIELKNNGAEI